MPGLGPGLGPVLFDAAIGVLVDMQMPQHGGVPVVPGSGSGSGARRLLLADALRSGAGRLAADVEDVRARRRHGLCRGEGGDRPRASWARSTRGRAAAADE